MSEFEKIVNKPALFNNIVKSHFLPFSFTDPVSTALHDEDTAEMQPMSSTTEKESIHKKAMNYDY